MVGSQQQQDRIAGSRSHDSLDDAEKGMCESTVELASVPSTVELRSPPSTAQLLNSSPSIVEVRGPPPFSSSGPKKPLMHIDTHLFPGSPVHEGTTPFSSVPELSLSWPTGWRGATDAAALKTTVAKKPAPPKPKPSRWILFNLWFNTYRKFFIFVTVMNAVGIIMAALGRFAYAENHLGALVLGNLLCAILMRNELFLRFLYIIAIYGLRSVRAFVPADH